MVKKIQAWLTSLKQKNHRKGELVKLQKYYEALKCGTLLLKFIYNDMANQKNKMPRAQLRRFEKAIKEEGRFSEEIINYYMARIDEALRFIDKEIVKVKAPVKTAPVQPKAK
jgi:hypothetical protein